jgi:hypothetical protein
MSHLRFSYPAAIITGLVHIGAFGIFAIVPDLVMPDLEFSSNLFRDIPEEILLAPAIFVYRISPGAGALLDHYFFWLCSGIWACLGGLAWSLYLRLRNSRLAKT